MNRTTGPGIASCLSLLLLIGCGADPLPLPTVHRVDPPVVGAGKASLLRVWGSGFPVAGLPVVRLRAPASGEGGSLRAPVGVSAELVVGVVPAGLPPGRYDVELTWPDLPRLVLPGALTLQPSPRPADTRGPLVWLEGPDPSVGVRAGSTVEVVLAARDPAGVARLGFTTSGLVSGEAERTVSSGSDLAWTTIRLPIPDWLEPLQLFWILPHAADRLGNEASGVRADSLIVCDPAGDPATTPFGCPD